jgi:hypothetical protein
MNKLLVLLSLTSTAWGGAFSVISSGPGQLVPYGEVEHAMGACADFDIVAHDVCSANCGYTRIPTMIPGTLKIDPAVACSTVPNCTAPTTLATSLCAGS